MRLFQLVALTLSIMIGLSLYAIDQNLQRQVEQKNFLSPTQYYASPRKFYPNQVIKLEKLQEHFSNKGYRNRDFGTPLAAGDFSVGQQSHCQQIVPDDEQLFSCFLYKNRNPEKLFLITLNEWDQILQVYSGDDLELAESAEGESELFAQYLGSQPTNQIEIPLSEIPRYCLDAVLAIEDPDFLEHSGVSLRGLLRAVAANLKSIRWSQGGSTITQQLVKNYFLTPEKTLWRKIKEIVLALVLEARISKDQILETYLNIIYLGQSGVFEVRGYGAASQYYFNKPLEDLNLGECSLLAAVVNSPGRYNPVTHPDRAQERRVRVLEKMLEHGFISEDEKATAVDSPLPKTLNKYLADSASYYVDAVNKEIKNLGFSDLSGLRIYTGLQPYAQKAAEDAVKNIIADLETYRPQIKKIKEEESKKLQALLIASDLQSGEITALVGGRNFANSPYNRAIESRRQVGSIFKPLVYLTALKKNVSPLAPLNNSPFKYEYSNQVWEPKNYDKTFSAPVPMFYALKESLNIPTARLAIDTGLDDIIETAQSLGIHSTLKPYPSLSLGAFELSPLEVLEVYSTIARRGVGRAPILVKRVLNSTKDVLYENQSETSQRFEQQATDQLIAILEEALRTGTGQGARRMGLQTYAAGKTGTTSDNKDAWFAGFTPRHVAVAWVGYDDGTPLGLTGASGALPLWTRYMRVIVNGESHGPFTFSEELTEENLSLSDLIERGVPEAKAVDTRLLLRKEGDFIEEEESAQ